MQSVPTLHSSWETCQLCICFPQQMRCYSIISEQQTPKHPPFHTHTHAGMDGPANQPSRLQPNPRLCASLLQQCDSHSQASQPVEHISLHLHRKRWQRFHFSISLCTYIHLLINLACSNQPCKHGLKVWGACRQQRQKIVPVMAHTSTHTWTWCVMDFAKSRREKPTTSKHTNFLQLLFCVSVFSFFCFFFNT